MHFPSRSKMSVLASFIVIAALFTAFIVNGIARGHAPVSYAASPDVSSISTLASQGELARAITVDSKQWSLAKAPSITTNARIQFHRKALMPSGGSPPEKSEP